MSKTIVLCALTIGLTVGLSSLGCYLTRVGPYPYKPVADDLSLVRAQYNYEREQTWGKMPASAARETLRQDWLIRFREDITGAYEKHGLEVPDYEKNPH